MPLHGRPAPDRSLRPGLRSHLDSDVLFLPPWRRGSRYPSFRQLPVRSRHRSIPPGRPASSKPRSRHHRKARTNDLQHAYRPQQAPPMGVDVPMTTSTRLSHQSTIAAVGTAVAGEAYTQQQLLETFQITDPRVRSVFLNSAIE